MNYVRDKYWSYFMEKKNLVLAAALSACFVINSIAGSGALSAND